MLEVRVHADADVVRRPGEPQQHGARQAAARGPWARLEAHGVALAPQRGDDRRRLDRAPALVVGEEAVHLLEARVVHEHGSVEERDAAKRLLAEKQRAALSPEPSALSLNPEDSELEGGATVGPQATVYTQTAQFEPLEVVHDLSLIHI